MIYDFGNIENFEEVQKYNSKMKRWVTDLYTVYNPSSGIYRVKYSDCRLPVAVIFHFFRKFSHPYCIDITERSGTLYFMFSIIIVNRVNMTFKDMEHFSKLHDFKYKINASVTPTHSSYVVTIEFPNYKKVDSTYMRSIRSINKFKL